MNLKVNTTTKSKRKLKPARGILEILLSAGRKMSKNNSKDPRSFTEIYNEVRHGYGLQTSI